MITLKRRCSGRSRAVADRRSPLRVLLLVTLLGGALAGCGTNDQDDALTAASPATLAQRAVVTSAPPSSSVAQAGSDASSPPLVAEDEQEATVAAIPTATPSAPPNVSASSAPPPVVEGCVPPDPPPTPAATTPLVTSDEDVRIREGPGGDCGVVDALPASAEVTALSGPVEADGRLWLLIEAAGVRGWVAAEFVAPAAERAAAEVVVLLYHQLDRPTADTTWSVTTAEFEAQLRWLKEQGYASITLSELITALADGGELPARAVVITVDDGYAEAPRMVELLTKHGFEGAFFLPSRMQLTPDQVRALDANGGEICGHTVNHLDLTTLDQASQREEIADNKRFLERIVGHPIRCFAYPFGRADEVVLATVRETGYEVAVTMGGGPVRLDGSTEPLRIDRIPVLGGLTLTQFAALVGAVDEGGAVPDVPDETIDEALPAESSGS